MIYKGFSIVDSTHVNDIQHIHLTCFMFFVFGHNKISHFLKFKVPWNSICFGNLAKEQLQSNT
jgi:hypothetical protein